MLNSAPEAEKSQHGARNNEDNRENNRDIRWGG